MKGVVRFQCPPQIQADHAFFQFCRGMCCQNHSFWVLISLVLWVYQWSPFCYPWPAFGGTQIQLSGQVTRFLPKSSKFSNPVPPTKWVFSFNSLLVSQTNTSPCSLNQMLLITVLTLNPHFLQLLEISTAANIFYLTLTNIHVQGKTENTCPRHKQLIGVTLWFMPWCLPPPRSWHWKCLVDISNRKGQTFLPYSIQRGRR